MGTDAALGLGVKPARAAVATGIPLWGYRQEKRPHGGKTRAHQDV